MMWTLLRHQRRCIKGLRPGKRSPLVFISKAQEETPAALQVRAVIVELCTHLHDGMLPSEVTSLHIFYHL